jgi:hypothetical protein
MKNLDSRFRGNDSMNCPISLNLKHKESQARERPALSIQRAARTIYSFSSLASARMTFFPFGSFAAMNCPPRVPSFIG